MNLPVRFALTVALAVIALPISARPPVPISHLAPGQQLKWDSKFIHVHELRPGMRGYALTVFKGTKISRYGIEILGIVERFNAGKDYIMFRVTDGPPVTRGLGIAHGMSGSPIYIGGRLAGAIAYGNQFAKDPIGFATPIEDMFDAWSPDLPSKIPSISASAPSMAQDSEAAGQHNMPLMVSGMTARGLARLSAALGADHFTVMAGSAGSSDGTNPLALGPTLVPGSAVGVSLVQGDMDASATGTVTYRDGNRLLLFGHPFQNLGPIDAALTTAYVVDIFPSYQSGELIGSPIKTVGRIFQDRPFSVGGVIGPMPQMIPMTVAVNDQSIHRRKNFHVRIINHPLLTGQFITGIADAAIAQVHGDPGDSMATVSMDVDVEEIGHVKRVNTFYDPLSIDQSAVEDLDNLMHLLSANPFYPLAVRSVKIDVTIQNKHDTAEIDHLFIKQTKFAPGDTVNVGVVLKPYKRELFTQMIAVKIPASVPDGPFSLNIRGGAAEGGGTTSLLGGLIQVRSAEPAGAAANVAQIVRQFTEKPRNNALVAHLQLPTSAIDIKGEKLSNLPPTLETVMQSTRSTGLHTERDEVKVITPSSYIISGSQTLTITVSKKDVTEPTSIIATAASAPASTSPVTVIAEVASADISDSEARLTGLAAVVQATLPAPIRFSSPSSSPELGSPPRPNSVPSGPPELGQGGDISSLKTVGRLASTWRQNTAAEFAAGTLQNVSVTSLGDVRLSAALQKVAETSATYLWALLPDGKGNLYLGTGDSGMIYKMDASGKVAPFFHTHELEVTSLAQDDAGNLYAGTAPHGIVFKVTPTGQGREIFTASEKYVTSLVYQNSHLYIATGGGVGSVYKLDTSSVVLPHAPLFTSPEAHILSLAAGKDGTIYAGSSPDGIVYKIGVDGTARILADLNEPNVSALATDSLGNVYAGTLPQGNVYKIALDGTSRRLFHAAAGIAALRSDANDTLYACAGSAVYRINPDETIQSYVAGADEQFLSLAVDPSASAIYTGTGTVASVYKIGAAGTGGLQGIYQSPVHDAGLPAHWGTLTWRADTPPGTQVTLETRSGDIERPDSSWSDWSAPYTMALGQTISSPPARYLQYQALLTSSAAAQAVGAVPKLSAVTTYYLPRNQPPTVSIVRPTGGAALSKAALLEWTAHDPDKDTLTYELSYSADSGKTWHPITKRAKPDSTPLAPAAAPKQSALSETQANLARQSGIPAAIRAQILAQAAQNSAVADSENRTSPLKQTSFSWDTTEVPDGAYTFRVIASDKASNPTGALTGRAISAPFLVANTAPQLLLGLPIIAADRTITLHGSVQTSQAYVKAIQGKVDGGDPQAAAADDGLFDSTSEPFTLTLPAPSTGTHSVEVQAEDQAGNVVTRTVRVMVP